ncbi:hypothetical protein D5R81_09400 [Parashewanella spongiae]|uniref:GST N-terminal domain-containing protein n=1 Tax=Parashewanella spongiae TaxID=342950 RepID=A0A3A6TU68_9GAMM|nr:glutathione S-transferase N-terminal domain-containing protein [Parashewanella spongiae]MCL1078107.1 glutathione S-transferase N-terminal domain-containing protein [Parashewanella spongiae]RJY16353.1 hypothetical protein D5R81_09400 [Parashewanella spongiae]
MRLLYSDASPYARMVRVAVHSLKLSEQIEQHIVNPFENNHELITCNPLGKIPCLILNDGGSIYDSEVIMRYLDAAFGESKLFQKTVDWQFATDFSLLKGLGTWRKNVYQFYRHSCERRSPESLVNLGTSRWIPAFAGMTN